jgi:hypothetical protein
LAEKKKDARHHKRCDPDSVQKIHRKCPARFLDFSLKSEAKTLADEDLRHFLALLAGKSWQVRQFRPLLPHDYQHYGLISALWA